MSHVIRGTNFWDTLYFRFQNVFHVFQTRFLICHQTLYLGNWGFLLHIQAEIIGLHLVKRHKKHKSIKNLFNSTKSVKAVANMAVILDDTTTVSRDSQ